MTSTLPPGPASTRVPPDDSPDTEARALAAWRLLAPLLAGAERMRVSKDGGRTFPGGKRGESALAGVNPRLPATLPVFDRESGTGRLLALDFDTGKAAAAGLPDPAAAVRADADAVTAAVTARGGRAICDVSPSGGRHVLVLFAAALPWEELRDLARAMSLRYLTLDWASTTSNPAAQITPPGSRHKSGGWRELAIPLPDAAATARRPCGAHTWRGLLEEFAAELSFIPGPRNLAAAPDGADMDDDGAPWLPRPGGRIRISAAMEDIARTGTWPRGRYDSRSDAREAVLVAAAACGWRLADIRAELAAGRWTGLAGLHTDPRERNRIRRLLPYEWASAVADLARARQQGLSLAELNGRRPKQKQHSPGGNKNPPDCLTSKPTHVPPGVGGSNELASEKTFEERGWIRRWATAMDMTIRDPSTADRWGKHAISVRLVLLALAQAAMTSGSRVVEFGTRNLALHAGVSQRTVARVLALLREEDPACALIDLISTAHMKRADRYSLVIPAALKGEEEWIRRRAGRIDAVHPVFAVLGGPAALAYAVLADEEEAPCSSVAKAALLSETATARALQVLAEHGLALHGPRGWKRGPALLDHVADTTGAADLHGERREQYRKDRESWQGIIGSWLAPPARGTADDLPWEPRITDLSDDDLRPPPDWYPDCGVPPRRAPATTRAG